MQMIEFVGMPRAGKTTQLALLETHLKASGYTVAIIDDRVRASQVIVPFADNLAYVISFATSALNEYYKHKAVDFLLIDRGFNDVRVWADFYCELGSITKQEKEALTVTFDRFAQRTLLTFNCQVSVDEAVQRHIRLGHTIAADELVMNKTNLSVLKAAYDHNARYCNHAVFIDGSKPVHAVEATIHKALKDSGLVEPSLSLSTS